MRKKAFTLVELIIVIAVLVILMSLIATLFYQARQKSKLSRVSEELTGINLSLTQYAEDNSYRYPADVSRGVPPGLEKYLAGGSWPKSVWPHGLFDWDNWIHPGYPANAADPANALAGQQIYQITYRLCDSTSNPPDPVSYCRDPQIFPNFGYTSGILYCVSGPCIPHQSDIKAPAYCVNCKPKEINPPL